MKLLSIKCFDILLVDNFSAYFKNKENIILSRSDSPIESPIPYSITAFLKYIISNGLSTYENTVGVAQLEFENNEGINIGYTATINKEQILQEALYRNGEIILNLDHNNYELYINKKLATSEEKMLLTSAITGYPSLFYCKKELINFAKKLTILDGKFFNGDHISEKAFKIFNSIILNCDLGIDSIDRNLGSVSKNNIQFSISEMGSGTKMLFTVLPMLIDTLLKGGICILSERIDFFSVLHPILGAAILKTINHLAEINNGQVIIPYYDNYTELLISKNSITNNNIVSLFREGKNLIYK